MESETPARHPFGDDGSAQRARHLFEGCGIELEYMLVDRASLDVHPIADRVLKDASGANGPVNDYSRGELAWSNELVMHVLELKNVQPTTDLAGLAERFQDEVVGMNRLLGRYGARLLPGGMHPWMNPATQTRLWPHDNAAVYRAYDRLFDCRTHGWANLQAAHVNLPFAGDAEFARLHAAVRVILPILPALAAASPYCDGHAGGILDCRMEAYRRNADAVPELNGSIIPEIVSSRAEYDERILAPMYRAVAPHDPEKVLAHEWLNARGAIARFDRNAIEIRVLDTQEHPRADVAFAAIVMDLAQTLCESVYHKPDPAAQLPTRTLADIFIACTHEADRARISSPEYLALFGMQRRDCDARALWQFIAERLNRTNAPHAGVWRPTLEHVLARGPLARRLLRAVGPRPSRSALHELYAALAEALERGTPFDS
ncbi:MAG: glutamate--cysteine ligase [Betaproteobacteria bacterium]|nr:glutamate--cysteine ligase [Betaproteobacteria bacterium]